MAQKNLRLLRNCSELNRFATFAMSKWRRFSVCVCVCVFISFDETLKIRRQREWRMDKCRHCIIITNYIYICYIFILYVIVVTPGRIPTDDRARKLSSSILLYLFLNISFIFKHLSYSYTRFYRIYINKTTTTKRTRTCTNNDQTCDNLYPTIAPEIRGLIFERLAGALF